MSHKTELRLSNMHKVVIMLVTPQGSTIEENISFHDNEASAYRAYSEAQTRAQYYETNLNEVEDYEPQN